MSYSGEDETHQFLDAEEVKAILSSINNRIKNLIGEGRPPSVSVKKRNLEIIDPKKGPSKDNIDSVLPGAGGSSASVVDDTDNISVRLRQKIEDENAHIEAILSATVSSKLSKSNTKGDANVLAGTTVPWSKLSEEQFECFYKEGVSLDLGRFRADKNNGGLTRTLFFRFHIRQLACLQLNVFKYLDRLYKDVSGLRIRTKWESDIRINAELEGHWSDLKMTEGFVAPEDMAKCLEYIESDFPDTFTKYSNNPNKPVRFNVVFQMVDSCVGIYKNINAIRGAQSLEMYGYSGKTFSKRNQQQGGGSGGMSNDLSAIISGCSNNNNDDDLAASTLTASSGLDLFGNAVQAESSEADTAKAESLFSSSTRVDFHKLYEGKLSSKCRRKEAQGAGSNSEYAFICDKNDAKFDIMDPLVILAPCKGNENIELMKSMIAFLDGRCEVAEDTITQDCTEFIGLDQFTCFDRATDLAVNLLMSSPVNIYRVASGLFVGIVCLKLRNVSPRTYAAKKPSTQGNVDRYVYGCDVRVTPNAHVNCRFRLDRSNCACETFCNSDSWTDQIREKNAVITLGRGYKPDSKKQHNCHHHVPVDYSWFDSYENKIIAQANKYMASKGEKYEPVVHKSVASKFDHMALDPDAVNSWMKCYSYSAMHTFFCHNMLPVWRPNFRFHFKNHRLMVQGRIQDVHRSDSKAKAWGVVQEGNSESAFKFIRENLELIPSGEMLTACDARQMSIREYATLLSLTPQRINKLNKDMAKSIYLAPAIISNNRNNISDELLLLKETVSSPIISKAFTHSNNSVKADNRITESKESRRMLHDFARFCLEVTNVNFLMGLNKRTFHSIVYNMNGMRIGGKDVKDVGIHQFIVSVDSALVAGDYFSRASAAVTHADGVDLNEEFGVDAKRSSAEEGDTEMYLSINAKSLLLDDDDDDDDDDDADEHASKAFAKIVTADASPSKRNREDEDEEESSPPSKREKKDEIKEVAKPTIPSPVASPGNISDDDIGFDG